MSTDYQQSKLTLPQGLKFVLAHDKDQRMKGGCFSEEQIIGILNEHEANVSVADPCRKHWRQRRRHLQMESEFRRDGGLGGQVAERRWRTTTPG
jgi:hypothetical protein